MKFVLALLVIIQLMVYQEPVQFAQLVTCVHLLPTSQLGAMKVSNLQLQVITSVLPVLITNTTIQLQHFVQLNRLIPLQSTQFLHHKNVVMTHNPALQHSVLMTMLIVCQLKELIMITQVILTQHAQMASTV
jgi:hypothetical protein